MANVVRSKGIQISLRNREIARLLGGKNGAPGQLVGAVARQMAEIAADNLANGLAAYSGEKRSDYVRTGNLLAATRRVTYDRANPTQFGQMPSAMVGPGRSPGYAIFQELGWTYWRTGEVFTGGKGGGHLFLTRAAEMLPVLVARNAGWVRARFS